MLRSAVNRLWPRVLVIVIGAAGLSAQTTQGLITGQVYDRLSGHVIPGAAVRYHNQQTGESGSTTSNGDGIYAWSNLSPGVYTIGTTAAAYQAVETSDIELFVAGRVEADIPMRPLSDVYDQKSYFDGFVVRGRKQGVDSAGRVIHFYAADIETTKSAYLPITGGEAGSFQSAVSYVIDSRLIERLPLLGRDVYATLSLVAGVTSDAPTSRSLGLAVNGQRPSSSNFLLDGVENNNYLVTGPLTTIAPEAVEEYRISTNSFAAEYGRTGGYLANVITRSGQNNWHGTAYTNVKNEALNANDFQHNAQSPALPRTPLKEWQPGFFVGGPVRRDSLFVSAAFDYLRFRSSRDPQLYLLPTTAFTPDPGSVASEVMRKYPARPVAPQPVPAAPNARRTCLNDGTCAFLSLAPPSFLDRYLALPRADYVRGEHRFMARIAMSRSSRPDFDWTPYPGFSMPLNENSISIAGSWTGPLGRGWIGEARAGWNSDDLRFDRPHPEIPTLLSIDNVTLPGSPSLYSFRNRSRGAEFVANASKLAGLHLLKIGGGALLRRVDGYLTALRDGQFTFNNLQSFGQDVFYDGLVSLYRLDFPQRLVQPDYNRAWKYDQFFAYAQDSLKLTPRLVLNYGLRYENYGAPESSGGGADAVLAPGPGSTLPEQLAGATLAPLTAGSQLFRPANNNWSVRAGFSYSLQSDARTVLRGSYGIYYDRPFDNLWQNLRNNNNLFGDFTPQSGFNYLAGLNSLAGSGIAPAAGRCDSRIFICDDQALAQFTLYNPDIGTPKIQNFFIGLQHRIGDDFSVELTGLGSHASNLITTDIVNRALSTAPSADNENGRFNPNFPGIRYRSDRGASDYEGLTAVMRYRGSIVQLQASYTWSHTIDNQSEPLAGDFFDLRFTSGQSQSIERQAAFTVQFDPRVDRGNSDFDQRHNLAFLSAWDLPGAFRSSKLAALFRDWKFAQIAALRTGLPYSVLVPASDGSILHNRADLVNPALVYDTQGAPPAAPGVKQLLNQAAFAVPSPDTVGDTGRNAFHGPGLFSMDVSLSRGFRISKLGESGRLTVRADAYNVLNHTNLNNPVSTLQFQGFGGASYGRLGRTTGFPPDTPFTETARQIQFQLRLEF